MGIMEDAEKALRAHNGVPVLERERIFGETNMPTEVTEKMLTVPEQMPKPVLELEEELPEGLEQYELPSRNLRKEIEEMIVILEMLQTKAKSLKELI